MTTHAPQSKTLTTTCGYSIVDLPEGDNLTAHPLEVTCRECFIEDVDIKSLHADDSGTYTAHVGSRLAGVFALAFEDLLREHGGPNYVELGFPRGLTVTVTALDGEAPSVKAARLEAAIEAHRVSSELSAADQLLYAELTSD